MASEAIKYTYTNTTDNLYYIIFNLMWTFIFLLKFCHQGYELQISAIIISWPPSSRMTRHKYTVDNMMQQHKRCWTPPRALLSGNIWMVILVWKYFTFFAKWHDFSDFAWTSKEGFNSSSPSNAAKWCNMRNFERVCYLCIVIWQRVICCVYIQMGAHLDEGERRACPQVFPCLSLFQFLLIVHLSQQK